MVLGYDRNDKTVEAFRGRVSVVHAIDLIPKLESGEVTPESMQDTPDHHALGGTVPRAREGFTV